MGEMVGSQVVSNAKNCITHIACLLGKQYDEPDVQILMKAVPFTCIKMPNGCVGVKVCHHEIFIYLLGYAG